MRRLPWGTGARRCTAPTPATPWSSVPPQPNESFRNVFLNRVAGEREGPGGVGKKGVGVTRIRVESGNTVLNREWDHPALFRNGTRRSRPRRARRLVELQINNQAGLVPALTGRRRSRPWRSRSSQARRLPGRLTTDQTAALLGFQPHDIAVLCKARLLAPLGQPAQSAPKYFAAVTIARLAADPAWLEEATIATTENWKRKNRAHQSKNGAHHPRQRRSRYAS